MTRDDARPRDDARDDARDDGRDDARDDARPDGPATDLPADLAELAEIHGVATRYDDQQGNPVRVSEATVVTVLGTLGVAAGTPQQRSTALAAYRAEHWRRIVAPTVVGRTGRSIEVAVHADADDPVEVVVVTEAGERRTEVPLSRGSAAPVDVDGRQRVELAARLPADLPPGWHVLEVRTGGDLARATLVVAPERLPLPPRAWGWMVQLYALRSAASWGLGDVADLRRLAVWSAVEHGAGLVVVNPLHAAAPVEPVEPSPYYPATRRFVSPLYLRVEETPEYAAAPAALRAEVDALRVEPTGDRVERDPVWRAKRAALELLWPLARDDRARRRELAAFRAREGEGLERFATWCVLAERHGVPWRRWPQELHDPAAPAVAAVAAEAADRVAFHGWLQLLCDEQLARAQRAARDAGMPVGVVHDLAVGVDPGGADAWGLQDALVAGVTVGAPPDTFNQQGQDWRQPPWHPQRLAELGYAPYRDMLRSVLRHAGGIRVDHVLGLFRLWWVPEGGPASEGTYVRYDADALLGVLALEAERAGAVVVGEDLGTVEPRVREELADRGLLGNTVLWFERDDDGAALPPDRWRQLALACVTTHDLPTVAGMVTGAQVETRAELGLLSRPVEEERAAARADLADWLAVAREQGLLAPAEESLAATSLALHGLVARSPSRLTAAALGDAVGDPRQPNQPGTVDSYPNWRLPVAAVPPEGGAPRPVLLEDLEDDPRVARLAAVMAGGEPGFPDG